MHVPTSHAPAPARAPSRESESARGGGPAAQWKQRAVTSAPRHIAPPAIDATLAWEYHGRGLGGSSSGASKGAGDGILSAIGDRALAA